MRKTGRCPKCDSTVLVENARLLDYTHPLIRRDLEVAAYSNPEAWVFKGEHRGTLAAWICTGCGFTELYCVDMFDRPGERS